MSPTKRPLAPLLLAAVLAGGCAAAPESGLRRPPPASAANPASMACVQAGGVSEIRRHQDGEEYGVCRTADGKVCEEWALYRDQLCVLPREGPCAPPAAAASPRPAGACGAASKPRANENALLVSEEGAF